MSDEDDVRRLALALPGTSAGQSDLRFLVGGKAFAWSYKERVDGKGTRVERRGILVVRVADEGEKQNLLAADPKKFSTDAHYDGYAAVLIRLSVVDTDELFELLMDAWRSQAPRALLADLNRDTDE